MWKTILRRILIMIPEMIALSVIVFLIAKAMPGDPFTGSISPKMNPARIHELMKENGLFDPWYQQYWNWVVHLFHGDLGTSYQYQEPVTTIIAQRAGNTIWLGILTTVFTYALGLPLGIWAAKHENKWQDTFVRFYSYITMAVPYFVVLVFGIWILGYELNWFPTSGSISSEATGTFSTFTSRLYHSLLPSLLGAFFGTIGIVQYLRTQVIDAKRSDYVKTARAKGVPMKDIYRHHILRNSLLPIAAFAGYSITGIIGGAIFTETTFSYPGMGQLFVNSVNFRDYTVITALVLIFGFMSLVGTLLSDIILSIVDPRVRVE